MKKKVLIIGATVLALIIIITSILGVVVISKSGSDLDYEDEEYKPASKYANTIEFDELTKSTEDVTPVPVNMSQENLDSFVESVSKVNVDYDFADLYNLEESTKVYNNLPSTKVSNHSYDIRVNGKFDVDKFYSLVKENNKKAFAELKKTNNDVFYKQYSAKELKKICTEMVNALNDIASKNKNLDVDTVSCFLHDISIYYSETGDFGSLAAFDMSNNRFYINYEKIDFDRSLIENNSNENIDEDKQVSAETSTIYHEMFHAFQMPCCDSKENGIARVGISADYALAGYNENEIVNAYSWYWLSEGAAEINMKNHLEVNASTYFNNIDMINDVNYVLTLLNGKAVNIENITFNKDCDELFKLFGAETEDEKLEIVKMMYSIEVDNSNNEQFESAYEAKYNVSLADPQSGEKEYYTYRLKEDYMMTLTKYFYKALAKQVATGKASKQDIFYLIKKWEAGIVQNFNAGDYGNEIMISIVEFHTDFYNEYLKIQDSFFDSISKDSEISKEELINGYENYQIQNISKESNCDLAFLNDSAIKNIRSSIVLYYDYYTIRECDDLAKSYDAEYPISELMNNRKNLYKY